MQPYLDPRMALYDAFYDPMAQKRGHDYGVAQPGANMQGPRAHGLGVRRQLNRVGILTALFVPFGLFVGTFYVMSFGLYYRQPNFALMIVGSAFLLVLAMGAFSLQAKRTEMTTGQRTTWHHFVFMTALIGCLLGSSLGYLNLDWNGMRYYDYISLRKAVNVDPGSSQGLSLLDAGEIDFQVGTHIDLKSHYLWHKTRTYCVAPIVSGTDPLASYDFWAVGMDCCSAKPGDFSCTDVSSTSYQLAGLRVMDHSEIQGYTLAVEQATAAHNMQSRRPIFLYMMKSPYAKIKSYLNDAQSFATLAFVGYFIMQSVLVAVQSYTFGKDTPSGYMDVEKCHGYRSH